MKSFLPLDVILGSDFPVEPPAVLRGVYAAVTRKDPGKNGEGEGWMLGETLEVGQALRGFTANVARGAGMEGRVGVLGRGAWADWVVIGRDLITGGEGGWEWLLDEEVVRETWVAGKRVFNRD